MNVQVRNDKVIIDGYVNAVERFSKALYDTRGKFIERVMPKVFERALEKNDNVLVLLNHNYDKELANTKEGTAKLYEDNIGLRAIVEITDEQVIQKANSKKLRGWSFGFKCNKEDISTNDDGLQERTIRDLELIEVSIIDDQKIPAYYGTSIEMRDDGADIIEFRGEDFDYENTDIVTTITNNQKKELLLSEIRKIYTESYIEDYDDSFVYANIDNTYQVYKIPYSINDNILTLDVNSKVKVIKGGYVEVRENKKIDYSEYQNRLDKLAKKIVIKY